MKEYLKLAQELAAARVRFAREWQMQRGMYTKSDMAATQAAIEITKDEITVIQAQMRIYEWNVKGVLGVESSS